jgi:hypothetical protein
MHLTKGQLCTVCRRWIFIFESDQAPINSLPVYDLGTSFASVLPLSNPSEQEIATLQRQAAAGFKEDYIFNPTLQVQILQD